MNVSELLRIIDVKVGLMEDQKVKQDRRQVRREIESHISDLRECLGLALDNEECPGGKPSEETYLPYRTPYQRLSLAVQRAFHNLRSKDYECYAELLCCQTCALSAIEGDKYAFWHSQDTDNAMRDGTLLLCWDGEGEEVVESLRKAGLEVEWDGDSGRRIAVRHLQDENEGVAA